MNKWLVNLPVHHVSVEHSTYILLYYGWSLHALYMHAEYTCSYVLYVFVWYLYLYVFLLLVMSM